MVVVFVGNDAEEARQLAAQARRRTREARQRPPAIRSSRACAASCAAAWSSRSCGCARLRSPIELRRGSAPPEPPLQSYAAASRAADRGGLAIARHSIEDITARASAAGASTVVVLMPARFQVDDPDYLRLQGRGRAGRRRLACAMAPASGSIVRALERAGPRASISCPPCAARSPDPISSSRRRVHLTPRGHEVVAAALDAFVGAQWPAYREEHRPTPR